ncbi:unnamed protein product [Peronospora destructor]|uniref:Uncharacterized protein n=1 Tax=Peronospora destructor TaxID=86335 RepID=A0AAV0U4P4_9STRA|nr:unnamed protein product [Peronospora destructor]
MVNVVVNSNPSYSNQKYDRIEICGQGIECDGATKEECYEHMSALSPRTYWNPDGVNFFPVDAVVIRFHGVLLRSIEVFTKRPNARIT